VVFGEDIAIIDTGLRNQWRQIIKAIEEKGRKPKDVKYIILTHTHPYVLGGLGELVKKTNAQILCTQSNSSYLNNYEDALTTMFGLDKKQSALYTRRRFPVRFKPIEVKEPLKNRGVVNLGDKKLLVIETNGHSAGHVALWEPGTKTLFAGDELLNYPNNFAKFIVDRTGSFKNREFALTLFLELEPSILCLNHDIPVMDDMIKEYLNNALVAQALWERSVLEYIQMVKDANTRDIDNYVKKSLGVVWSETMEKFENHSTTISLLLSLEEEGVIKRVVEEKSKKKKRKIKLEDYKWRGA